MPQTNKIETNNIINPLPATTIKLTESIDEMTLVDVISMTENSVVEIATETVVNGSIMRQFISEGAGSGVIIKENGYIITAYHVIEDATKIKVTLKNGENYEAKLIGSDSDNDTAIIKIEKTGLTSAVMGDSDLLKVGQTAIAIGNPLGQLGGTVTTGIISALDREIDLGDTIMNLLQTNAAINPGNSGGALFNSKGELIGITIAKSTGSDVEGLGFAIPINDVKDIVNDILTYGYVRGKIQVGVNLLDVSNVYTAMLYGLNSTGVYVQNVVEGSSAEKAGLKPGDRIVEFDGKNIMSFSEFKKELNKHEVGETVELVVVREGREKTLKVYLSEYKGE
jgi:serine protease Do